LREPMHLCTCVSEEGGGGEAACSGTPSLSAYILRYVSFAEVIQRRQRLVPKLNLSVLDECRTDARGDKTVLESMTETCEGRRTSVPLIAHPAFKIGTIKQHSEAKHYDKLNATSTANEVSPGTKVASWYIASGNELRDDALSRPLLGTHWLLAEGCDDKQKQPKTVAAVFHTVPESRGSTPAYTRTRPSSAIKPHKFTRARPSSVPWDRHENKEEPVAANAEYRALVARFHRHHQQGGIKTGVMKD